MCQFTSLLTEHFDFMEEELNTQRLAAKTCRLDKCSDLIWKQSEEQSLYLVSRNVRVWNVQKKFFFLLSHGFKSSVRHNRLDRHSTGTRIVYRYNTIELFLITKVLRQPTRFRFPRKLLLCLILYCEPVLVTVCDSCSCVDVLRWI